MVPGWFEDPDRIIGKCLYCDDPVAYALGDHDPDGRPRHDSCERAATKHQLSGPRGMMLFQYAITLLRDLPDVKPALREAIEALPKKFGSKQLAIVVSDIIPYVELERSIDMRKRHELVLALRSMRTTLTGLDAAT